MKVIRARTAGFCMGVALALRKLDGAINERKAGRLERKAGRLLMLGPIIHNPQVLEGYAALGVSVIASVEEARAGDTVIIRAHGIPRHEEARLMASGACVVDATCPRVKQAQLAISRATANGQTLYLYGEANHPEVQGLVSCAGGPCHVFADPDTLVLPQDRNKELVLAAQTTQDRRRFDSLRQRFAHIGAPLTVLSTICDATRERQEEAAALAREVPLMVVVGGRDSGNTRRLAEVAAAAGAAVLHVETAAELDRAVLHKYDRAGITAGASTPKELIDAVQRVLEEEVGRR